MTCRYCGSSLQPVHGHGACLTAGCPMFGLNQDECCSGETCPPAARVSSLEELAELTRDTEPTDGRFAAPIDVTDEELEAFILELRKKTKGVYGFRFRFDGPADAE